jgi:hypothetical protein
MNVDAEWRLYMVGARLYQLAVIGVETSPTQESIKKFFKSFVLLED